MEFINFGKRKSSKLSISLFLLFIFLFSSPSFCKTIGELVQEGMQFLNQGEYDEALKSFEEAIERGGENPEVFCYAYFGIGKVYMAQERYKDALENYEKVIKLAQENNFQELLATSFNDIGLIYRSMRIYDKALESCQNALAVGLNVYGEKHQSTATFYNSIGSVYYLMGVFDKALESYQNGLNIILELFGEKHQSIATFYNSIGLVYYSMGVFDKALESYQDGLNIILELFGEKNLLTAAPYDGIGTVYYSIGEYDKALEFYQKALNIRLELLEQYRGSRSALLTEIATSYNSIGLSYCSMGEYDKALEFYQKALNIALELYGEKHPLIATIYHNIGSVYDSTYEYDKALDYHNKALNIKLELYGEKHQSVAISYSGIAEIYTKTKEYDKALEFYQKALNITLELYGEKHQSVAISYSGIAEIYTKTKEYDKALEFYQKALNIILELYGEKHPLIAIVHLNIGGIYHSKEEYDKAIEFYEKAEAIFKEKKLYESTMHTGVLKMLALKDIGNYEDALRYADDVIEGFTKLQEQTLFVSVEKGALKTGERYERIFSLIPWLYMQTREKEKAYSIFEEGKMRVFEAMMKRNQLVLKDMENKDLWDKRVMILTRLSNLRNNIYKMRAERKDKVADNLEVETKRFEDELLSVERELLNKSRLYGEILSKEMVKVEEIQKRLSPDTVFIEYAFLEDELYAFVITDDSFSVNPLITGDKEMNLFKVKFGKNKDAYDFSDVKELKDLYEKEKKSETKYLYSILIGRVEKLFEGKKRLVIIPDKELHLLPFEMLIDKEGKFLIESYEISYLNSAKEGLRTIVKRGEDYLGYGGIKYEKMGKEQKNAIINKIIAEKSSEIVMKAGKGRCIPENLPFLKGSKEEIDVVHSIIGSGVVRYGYDASESTFKHDVKGKRYVHLSTHGYYYECGDALINSGVAFSGALGGGDGIDDGLLSALEVMGLDLEGVELTVLSACETGLGKIGGEGVYGLKRAFMIAGTKEIVISLWKISDKETKELMEFFFRDIKMGRSTTQAIRNAKLKMIKKINQRYGKPYPFFWAAFVLVGG